MYISPYPLGLCTPLPKSEFDSFICSCFHHLHYSQLCPICKCWRVAQRDKRERRILGSRWELSCQQDVFHSLSLVYWHAKQPCEVVIVLHYLVNAVTGRITNGKQSSIITASAEEHWRVKVIQRHNQNIQKFNSEGAWWRKCHPHCNRKSGTWDSWFFYFLNFIFYVKPTCREGALHSWNSPETVFCFMLTELSCWVTAEEAVLVSGAELERLFLHSELLLEFSITASGQNFLKLWYFWISQALRHKCDVFEKHQRLFY